MNGNRRELNVLGTFVCEDNFDIARMAGKFYVNNKEYDTYSFEPGENIQYIFSFINTEGQLVPHCFRQGIWTYSFSLSLDCSALNYNIRMKDEYSLILSMNACSEVGKHSISISENSHGVGPEGQYTIKVSENPTLNNTYEFNNISDSLCPGDNINDDNCIDCFYNIIINNKNSNNDSNIIMDIQNAIINHKLDKCIDKIIIKEN